MTQVSPQRRVPVELEPLGDLEKGEMSEGVWRELNDVIQYEARSVQTTGVIVPSPARNKNRSSMSPDSNGNHSPSSHDRSLVTTSESHDTSIGMTKFPRRFPAMESFFQALATLGVEKSNYRGLAMLHNSAHLGVWQSNSQSANAALRAQLQEKVAAQSEAIDEQLRQASDRARVLREEQQKELAEQKKQQEGGAGDDTYLKGLQNSRIEAEFERMRDQLRAEDAARREQLEYAREQRAKEDKEKDLEARKARLREEREQRHREREERLRELQQLENKALDEFESKLREHGKVGHHAAAAAATPSKGPQSPAQIEAPAPAPAAAAAAAPSSPPAPEPEAAAAAAAPEPANDDEEEL